MARQSIELQSADGVFAAYTSSPEETPAPAIIVLQEIFGVNAVVKGVCDWLADHGYLALAPDLFWRQELNVSLSEVDRERAMQLMQGFDEARGVEDCKVALDYLRKAPESTGKVGAVGYCLGGKLAYLMATRSSVDAAVSYYGVGIHKALGEAKNIRAPIAVYLAEEDAHCPSEAQAEIKQALGGTENIQIETFAGAGHAFARTGSGAYHQEAAGRANKMMLAFFAEHLR